MGKEVSSSPCAWSRSDGGTSGGTSGGTKASSVACFTVGPMMIRLSALLVSKVTEHVALFSLVNYSPDMQSSVAGG